MQLRLTGIRVDLPQSGSTLFKIKSFEVPSESRVLIHAPSGKGKTTLLHMMAGLFLPLEGYVFVGDRNLGFLSESQRCELRRTKFGIIFQKLNLLEDLTVFENVQLGMTASNDRKQVTEALEKLKLSLLAHRLTKSLSGGEQQRVAVARVLASAPQIILADEPTSSLDEANAEAVIDSILDLPHKPTIIVASHDQRIRSRFSQVIPLSEIAQ